MREHKHTCPCLPPLLVTHKLLLGSKLKNVQILRSGEANLEDSSHCEDHRTPWIKSVCPYVTGVAPANIQELVLGMRPHIPMHQDTHQPCGRQ